eukprot:TRINITY_DN1967_c0_g1_i1.p1 TRINITY_DN1967_c0_g1~~TRINITY_DN1967_c0_g1_i1.p1  ORF type:complete len:553 (+),score=131.11 TRINITY_DN1967_c0_g1_i1:122-1780(+)
MFCGLALFFLFPSLVFSLSDVYTEDLFLKPLDQNGNFIGAFFKMSISTEDIRSDHFEIFPRPLGELLEEHGLREFRVTLGRGVWRSEIWGWPPSNSAPPGAVVSGWFEPGRGSHGAWKGLVNALSGQLCASLNFLDEAQSLSPAVSFSPEGAIPKNSPPLNISDFKMASLPGENVCTENLTPWKKLLPCQGRKGLASLLTARKVQESSFHSLGLSLKPKCGDETCSSLKWELEMLAHLVFDMGLQKQKEDWSLRSLFGTGLHSECPLASSATIYWKGKDYSLSPSNIPHRESSGEIMIMDLPELLQRGIHNVQGHYLHAKTIREELPPPVTSTRFLTGYGQEKGGIVTQIKNGFDKELPIVFLDVIPWYLRLYIHTLSIRTDKGVLIEPHKTYFTPGRDRERPYILELVLSLPPHSVTSISIEFERSLLKWLEYPPDANKGFYVGSALISTRIPSSSTDLAEDSQGLLRLYTEVLLVSLPTPDFSMPYNVICLACTVIALAFGPLHNITTKKLIVMESTGPNSVSPSSKLEGIKNKIKGWFKKTSTVEEKSE